MRETVAVLESNLTYARSYFALTTVNTRYYFGLEGNSKRKLVLYLVRRELASGNEKFRLFFGDGVLEIRVVSPRGSSTHANVHAFESSQGGFCVPVK